MGQQLMTVELLKVALPKNLHSNATQEFADLVNGLAVEPETGEEIRSNFLTYSKVLQEGKWKTEDYLNAVAYVTHKLMGYNNTDAYIRTFPDRYQALVARGASSKDISAYVAAYHRNKLVNAIMEQTLLPAHLVYQDAFHKAIRTQIDLMDNAVSEKVRAEAANSILTHLKAPETKKVELDVNVKSSSGLDDLRSSLEQLAKKQLEVIEGGGMSAGEVAGQKLRLSPEEKAQAIDVTPAPVQPAKPVQDIHDAECQHGVPYRYACAVCDAEPAPAEMQQAMAQRVPNLFDPQPGNPGVPPPQGMHGMPPEMRAKIGAAATPQGGEATAEPEHEPGEAAAVAPPARAQPESGTVQAARPTLFPSLFDNPHQD